MCVSVVVQGIDMWVAHVGDCRAVVGKVLTATTLARLSVALEGIDEHTGQMASKLVVEELTRDHRCR